MDAHENRRSNPQRHGGHPPQGVPGLRRVMVAPVQVGAGVERPVEAGREAFGPRTALVVDDARRRLHPVRSERLVAATAGHHQITLREPVVRKPSAQR